MKRLFFILLIIVVLGFGAWMLVSRFSSPSKDPNTSEPRPIPPEFLDDQDRDGIKDIDETAQGTSPTSSDSDGDGLSDETEITVWKTNPNNPDTDNDGFWDGLEIVNGTNPLVAEAFSEESAEAQ